MNPADSPAPADLTPPLRPEAPPPSKGRFFLFRLLFWFALFQLTEPTWRPLADFAWRAATGAPADDFKSPPLNDLTLRAALVMNELETRQPRAARLAGGGDMATDITRGITTDDNPRMLRLRLISYKWLGLDFEASAAAARIRELNETDPPDPLSPLAVADRIYIDREPPDEEELERLRAGLGLFGLMAELRASELEDEFGESERTAALRAAVSDRLMRSAVALIALPVGIAAGSMAGLALLAVFIGRARTGRVAFRLKEASARAESDPEAARVVRLIFEAFVIYLSFAMLSRRLAGGGESAIRVAGIIELSSWLVLFYPVAAGASGADVFRTIGLYRPWRALPEIAAGVAGYVAMIPLMMSGLGVSALVARLTGVSMESGAHPVIPELAGEGTGLGMIAAILILAVVLAPVMEEILFRGCLQRGLRESLGPVGAIAASAAVFAAIHPQGLIGFFPLFAIGTGLGVLREWRDGLLAPVTAHACVNGVTMTFALAI